MSEKIIPKNRSLSRLSSEKLRRARRLYYRLIFKSCAKSRNMIFVFAQRAQSRGLLSSKTGFRDVCFSILRGARKAAYDSGNKQCTQDFLDSYHNDAKSIHNFCKIKKRGGKPVLRVRG